MQHFDTKLISCVFRCCCRLHCCSDKCDSSGVSFWSRWAVIILKSVGFVAQCLGVIPYWWSDGLLVMSSHKHSYPAFNLWDWLLANLKYQVSSAEYPYGLRGNCSFRYVGTGDCRSRLRSTFTYTSATLWEFGVLNSQCGRFASRPDPVEEGFSGYCARVMSLVRCWLCVVGQAGVPKPLFKKPLKGGDVSDWSTFRGTFFRSELSRIMLDLAGFLRWSIWSSVVELRLVAYPLADFVVVVMMKMRWRFAS